MSKLAAIILSSPRKGSNSNALARAVAEGLVKAGGRVEFIDLAGLDIKPCLACGNCQSNGGRCSQVDGMRTAYPKLREASILVLATPVYMFNMSAQLKTFLDRCYALLCPEDNAVAGKTLAAAISYGADDLESSGAGNVVKSLQDLGRHTQMSWAGFIHGRGLDRDALAQNGPLLEQARALGAKLIG
ncbi:MAG: flavodoxin family protein [Candidatus Adiutrix sp.]|jgi:multimeric flavodoxin WrbA|nr:flavodoxin family protein [Candidatus Adiutrix sp.]